MKVQFADVGIAGKPYETDVLAAAIRVLKSGNYIGGSEVEALEREFVEFCGAAEAVSVRTGTDALTFALRAAGVGLGDEVITVPLTFIATAEAISHAGATPVFVDVDPETGAVRLDHYVVVSDSGRLINPTIAEGQIVGGIAQGLGGALLEHLVYDADGQLLSSSYLDYLIPSAMEVPELAIGHVETPSPYTPHGVKGGGEGGRMMAPAAINAAVNDALAPLGVRLTELPMTPERILSALRAAGKTG